MTIFFIIVAALIIFAGGFKLGQKYPHPVLIEKPDAPTPVGGVTGSSPKAQ